VRRTILLLSTMTIAVLAVSGAMLFGMGKPAQSQSDPEPPCQDPTCIDKTASPSTVTAGQPITFTITQRCPAAQTFGCLIGGPGRPIVDTLPPDAGLTNLSYPAACTLSGNTLTCDETRFFTATQPYTLTIVATPTECGTFTNTATFSGIRDFRATATFKVVGCPPPTKEECKNGGWEKFGFPNQGRCESAVNRQNRQ
jgi:hypothetical protein